MERFRARKITTDDLAVELYDQLGKKSFESTQNLGKFKQAWMKEKTRTIIEIKSFVDLYKAFEERKNKDIGDLEAMHPFYQEAMQAAIPFEKIKKAISHLQVTTKLVDRLKRETLERVRQVNHETHAPKLAGYRKHFLGRAKSFILRLDKTLYTLEQVRKIRRDLPGVDVKLPTLVLAGFPNAGKSTILGRWTGSQVRVAPYPFTTQAVQVGKIEDRFAVIQILDTPGLLDRSPEKRNAIERHALSAIEHVASAIVFVVDASPQSAYSLKEQQTLYHSLVESLPQKLFLLVANKMDAAPPERILEVEKVFGPVTGKEGEGMESSLKTILAAWTEYRKKQPQIKPVILKP